MTMQDEDKKYNESVNHPSHYRAGNIEAIDVIEQFNLNYNLGNVIKYILRSERKGKREEDILKALWYLNREVQKAIKNSGKGH